MSHEQKPEKPWSAVDGIIFVVDNDYGGSSEVRLVAQSERCKEALGRWGGRLVTLDGVAGALTWVLSSRSVEEDAIRRDERSRVLYEVQGALSQAGHTDAVLVVIGLDRDTEG